MIFSQNITEKQRLTATINAIAMTVILVWLAGKVASTAALEAYLSCLVAGMVGNCRDRR